MALADLERMGDATGRCLVVHDHHRLDAVLRVRGKPGFDLFQIGATAPIARNEIDVELEFLRDAAFTSAGKSWANLHCPPSK